MPIKAFVGTGAGQKHCPALRGLRPSFLNSSTPSRLDSQKHCPALRGLRHTHKQFFSIKSRSRSQKHCPALRGLRRSYRSWTWSGNSKSETLPRFEGFETAGDLQLSQHLIWVRNIAPLWGVWDNGFLRKTRQTFFSCQKHCPALRGLRQLVSAELLKDRIWSETLPRFEGFETFDIISWISKHYLSETLPRFEGFETKLDH